MTNGIRAKDTPSSPTALGIEFVDIPILREQVSPIRFTFLLDSQQSMGRARLRCDGGMNERWNTRA